MIGRMNDRAPLPRATSRTNIQSTTPRAPASMTLPAPGLKPIPSVNIFNAASQPSQAIESFTSKISPLSTSLARITQDLSSLGAKMKQLETAKTSATEELNLNLEQLQLEAKIAGIQAGVSIDDPNLELVYQNLREVNQQALSGIEQRYRTERKALRDAKTLRGFLGAASLWASILLL